MDEKSNHGLIKKTKKPGLITMKRYFQLLRVYGQKVIEDAKKELIIAITNDMMRSWMNS